MTLNNFKSTWLWFFIIFFIFTCTYSYALGNGGI